MKIKQMLKNILYFKKVISIKDTIMILGIIMAGKGLYLIYLPSMWLAIGIFLIFLGWPRMVVKNGNIR